MNLMISIERRIETIPRKMKLMNNKFLGRKELKKKYNDWIMFVLTEFFKDKTFLIFE